MIIFLMNLTNLLEIELIQLLENCSYLSIGRDFPQWTTRTWEDVDNLYTDVPVLVANFIRRLKSENHILADDLFIFISANQKS